MVTKKILLASFLIGACMASTCYASVQTQVVPVNAETPAVANPFTQPVKAVYGNILENSKLLDYIYYSIYYDDFYSDAEKSKLLEILYSESIDGKTLGKSVVSHAYSDVIFNLKRILDLVEPGIDHPSSAPAGKHTQIVSKDDLFNRLCFLSNVLYTSLFGIITSFNSNSDYLKKLLDPNATLQLYVSSPFLSVQESILQSIGAIMKTVAALRNMMDVIKPELRHIGVGGR